MVMCTSRQAQLPLKTEGNENLLVVCLPAEHTWQTRSSLPKLSKRIS